MWQILFDRLGCFPVFCNYTAIFQMIRLYKHRSAQAQGVYPHMRFLEVKLLGHRMWAFVIEIELPGLYEFCQFTLQSVLQKCTCPSPRQQWFQTF